ncbi:hypothetical protein [Microvirga sp. 2TAF3]|uniref:hypothetical protein n=1 Tax=Microvirga sp. 2TAF3 TaxID=3233014 RepID=UPI003F9C8497
MHQHPTLVRRLTTSAITRLGVLILGLAFQVLLAKIMLPQEYAIFALALAGSSLFISIASLGISRAISRFLPELIVKGNKGTLRHAIGRAAVYRLASVFAVAGVTWFILGFYPLTSGLLHEPSRIIIIFWFVSLLLQLEAEAVALALMEHDLWSVASLLEILVRLCVTLFISVTRGLDASDVIFIWLLTSGTLVVGTLFVILARRHRYWMMNVANSGAHAVPSFNPRVQHAFALGIYVSSCAWMATSPAALRLVSAASLPVIPLAAISFVQGLISSVQRGLPVHLMAPTLEPLLISKSATSGKISDALHILSLLAKAETVLILFGIAIITPIASVMLGIIARPEFAAYGYVIPILMAQALGASYYRVLEIVAGMALRHRTFTLVAPLGLICLLLVFLTTPYLGLTAVLLWPSFEVTFRLLIIRMALRSNGAEQALDTGRLAPLVAATVALLVLGHLVAAEFNFGTAARFATSVATGFGFALLLFIIRPIRSEEYVLTASTFPRANRTVLKVLNALVH